MDGVGVSKATRQGVKKTGGNGRGDPVTRSELRKETKGSAVMRTRRVAAPLRHYQGETAKRPEKSSKRAASLHHQPQGEKRDGSERSDEVTTLQQDQRENTNTFEERRKREATPGQQHTNSSRHSYVGRPNTVDPVQAATTLGLSWQEWFRETGFLFVPELQEGHRSFELEGGEHDMLGSYSLVAGEFDGNPGQDIGVAAPRALNSLGKVEFEPVV